MNNKMHHLLSRRPNINWKLIKQKLFKHKKTRNALIITAAITALTWSTVYADNEKEKDLATVYHVYLNGTNIGTVNGTDVVESAASEKIGDLEAKYKGMDFSLSNQLHFVQEKMFRPTFDNEAAVAALTDGWEVEAEAALLSVENKPVAFLQTKEQAEEVLQAMKQKYASKETLEQLERMKRNNQSFGPLNEGETRIVDVQMSENVTIAAATAPPSQILTVAQAIQLLEKGTLEEKKYTVQEGDVLGTVANKHGLRLKELLALNKGLTEESVIKIGDELNVTQYDAYVHIVVTKETNQREVIPFKSIIEETKNMYRGETKDKQEGKNGERLVTSRVTMQNGIVTKNEVTNEQITVQPKDKITLKGTKVIPSRGTGDFSWPTSGGYISSDMGWRWGRVHKGIDIARPGNKTITAADNGVVIFAGWDGGYGNKIVINHKNGYKTVYGHLSKISVSVGDTVPKGTKIGVMGSTGRSTGVHLHFEVLKNGKNVDPEKFF